MRSADFEFDLPQRLVPALPLQLRGRRRDDARMAVVHRAERRVVHDHFTRLPEYFAPGDVLVVNDSMVVQDRLKGRTSTGAAVSVILIGQHEDGFHAIVRPAKLAKRNRVVRIGDGALRARIVKPTVDGMWLVRFEHEGDFHELLARYGDRAMTGMQRLAKRMETYRNVYATEPGSLEVPSAGLHFTLETLKQIEARGATIVPITLHIGLSERFYHLWTSRVEDQMVGTEWFRVGAGAAEAINAARRRGNRVFAVGTTVVRTLETIGFDASPDGSVKPAEGWTDLCIRPGHRYRVVDAMLTNLHQPRSSHLLLVSAFAGRDLVLDVYREIVKQKYRFDLFGDSMLLL
jgi:S-adenosylmethionine:tRNA ribosyltransferase-isomerase